MASYHCICGSSYETRSGLAKHKKRCATVAAIAQRVDLLTTNATPALLQQGISVNSLNSVPYHQQIAQSSYVHQADHSDGLDMAFELLRSPSPEPIQHTINPSSDSVLTHSSQGPESNPIVESEEFSRRLNYLEGEIGSLLDKSDPNVLCYADKTISKDLDRFRKYVNNYVEYHDSEHNSIYSCHSLAKADFEKKYGLAKLEQTLEIEQKTYNEIDEDEIQFLKDKYNLAITLINANMIKDIRFNRKFVIYNTMKKCIDNIDQGIPNQTVCEGFYIDIHSNCVKLRKPRMRFNEWIQLLFDGMKENPKDVLMFFLMIFVSLFLVVFGLYISIKYAIKSFP